MSTQTVTSNKSGFSFFEEFPDDPMSRVFEFLGGTLSFRGEIEDRAMLATALVCKAWRDNAVLIGERQEAANRLHQYMIERDYSSEIRQIFRQCNRPIANLPVLELNKDQDYIDWLQPADMSHPLMRFKTLDNRPGVAFSLQHRTHQSIIWLLQAFLADHSEEDQIALIQQHPLPTEVVTIFKRYAEPDSHWAFANDLCGMELRTPDAFEERHRVNPEFVQELLTDQHPQCRIAEA